MLFGWQDSWAAPGQQAKGVVFITCAQMLCGVAKDLTKLGGKTVTKLVTPEEKQVTPRGRRQACGEQQGWSHRGWGGVGVQLHVSEDMGEQL